MCSIPCCSSTESSSPTELCAQVVPDAVDHEQSSSSSYTTHQIRGEPCYIPMVGNTSCSHGCDSTASPTEPESNIPSTTHSSETRTRESHSQEHRTPFPGETQMWLAVYVTLAQVTLAFLLFLLYGFFKLLEEYLRPIIWAAICSVPLRGIQDILLEFWSEPLRSGLTDTLMAVPVAILRTCLGTIIDARDVISCVFCSEKLKEVRPEKNGFLRLVRRLVSFGLFVLAYEQMGRFGALTLLGLGFMFSQNLPPSTISAVSMLRSDSFSLRNKHGKPNQVGTISKAFTGWILNRLKAILAVGLILGMIVGSVGGVILFSYKIGAEGKDAVVSIKSHIEESEYAEKMGFKKLVYDSNVMELMDWYTSECYETLLEQIDHFAATHNLSELVETMKQFVITPNTNFLQNSSNPDQQETKYTLKLGNLMQKPVLDKAKCFAAQGITISFQMLANSKFILDGSAHLLLYIGQSIASGMHFLMKSTVFFWVLYYLLTSQSSEVTAQVMRLIPMSKPTKEKCVNSLNNAISGVLLATAEIAFFQGCFTWLLCRLFSTHFVYVSTLLGFISPLLPIFPPWLATLPGAIELFLNGRYVLAISFFAVHIAVMDYAASEIAECVPGYSTYLTGVSIIGGITLFPSPLEGAIMGPLITTVVIALKDLYTEFVLNEPKEKSK